MLQILPFIIIVVAGMAYAITRNRLTVPAAFTGAAIAIAIFSGAGYVGFAIMTVFFMLGTLATAHKGETKKQAGIAEANKGRRTASQVWANAGVAACLALLAMVDTSHWSLYLLMLAAAFSAAIADTLSSELGNVYGTRFFNIVSFKKDTKGLNGVVSLEGTISGLVGSTLIACIYFAFVHSIIYAFIIILAGTLGNLMDSLLGATLENKHVIDNNTVNFLNSAFGACVAGLLWWATCI